MALNLCVSAWPAKCEVLLCYLQCSRTRLENLSAAPSHIANLEKRVNRDIDVRRGQETYSLLESHPVRVPVSYIVSIYHAPKNSSNAGLALLGSNLEGSELGGARFCSLYSNVKSTSTDSAKWIPFYLQSSELFIQVGLDMSCADLERWQASSPLVHIPAFPSGWITCAGRTFT